VAAIVVAAWASGGAAANDKATMVPSTRVPDVADNLPRNWRDGSCRIIAETVTMAATDDMAPQVEVGIQGTRPRGVPTAWERTWAGMTRRAEPVAVDWLWRGRHLDLETGSPRTDPLARACWASAVPNNAQKIQTKPPATSDGCSGISNGRPRAAGR
jgi:hypothetical protein